MSPSVGSRPPVGPPRSSGPGVVWMTRLALGSVVVLLGLTAFAVTAFLAERDEDPLAGVALGVAAIALLPALVGLVLLGFARRAHRVGRESRRFVLAMLALLVAGVPALLLALLVLLP